MSNAYDQHYRKEAYFGSPYPGLVSFFEHYPERKTVLDLGCGQGRDALFLGRLGYHVVGVDQSEVGIRQLNATASRENLAVEGIVADLYSYPVTSDFDIVLLDSIVHFYQKDLSRESDLICRIFSEIKPGGILCNVMQKGSKREQHLKALLAQSGKSYEILTDSYIEYPEYQAVFHLFVVKKTAM